MKGSSHFACGILAGLATAPLIIGHQPDVGELVVVSLVVAGASFWPDADHHSASIAHTFGYPTRVFARFVGRISGGHRHATHSLLGAVVFGLLAWGTAVFGGTVGGYLAVRFGASASVTDVARQVGQYFAVICSLGLGVGGLGLTRKGVVESLVTFVGCAVFVLAAASSGVTFEWVPAAVVVGCLAHLAGDILTEQGIPVLWPYPRRFRLATLDTGRFPETGIVMPLVGLAIIAVALYRLGAWSETLVAAQNAYVAVTR